MPTPLRLTPSTLSGDDRRHQPWREGSRTKLVPLWTPEAKGQLFDGLIRVPTRLAHAKPDTNEKLEFDKLVRENIERWVEWRRLRGWDITSFPRVRGPYDAPTQSAKDEADPDTKHYFAQARFVRNTPAFVKLEDLLHERDRAALYGEDIDADRLPWNDTEGDGDTGWMDPMQHAAERRERLGLNRKDFLFGPLGEPIRDPGKAGVNPL